MFATPLMPNIILSIKRQRLMYVRLCSILGAVLVLTFWPAVRDDDKKVMQSFCGISFSKIIKRMFRPEAVTKILYILYTLIGSTFNFILCPVLLQACFPPPCRSCNVPTSLA